MIYLVESIDVVPGDLDRCLTAFATHYLPGARERGMELVSCLHTPADLGEDVTVTTTFALRDWAHWEAVRNAAVADPAVAAWLAVRREVMVRGTRRFHLPADLTT